MSKKNDDIEKQIEIEKAIAAEFSENDDIVDYVEGKALDNLRKRYAAADEDEEIRTEGFELAQKNGIFHKKRPSGYGYYYSPEAINNPNEIKNTGTSPLSELFDAAKSEYDSDSVSFRDIDLDAPTPDDVINEIPLQSIKSSNSSPINHQTAEEVTSNVDQTPVKRKRGRPKKVIENTSKNVDVKVEPDKKSEENTTIQSSKIPDAKPEEPPKRKRGRPRKIKPEDAVVNVEKAPEKEEEPQSTMAKGFNTNTKVVFIDEDADDGIKRNSDDQMKSVFSSNPQNPKKRHSIFSFLHKH